MSILDRLIKELGNDFRLSSNLSQSNEEDVDGLDILFHLPLICMTILSASASRKPSISTENAAHWVACALMELYPSFVFSLQRLRFSSVLRSKTVEAILFLESFDFIQVSEGESKLFRITPKGKKMLVKYRLGVNSETLIVKRIESALKRIEIKGLGLLQ